MHQHRRIIPIILASNARFNWAFFLVNDLLFFCCSRSGGWLHKKRGTNHKPERDQQKRRTAQGGASDPAALGYVGANTRQNGQAARPPKRTAQRRQPLATIGTT